MALLEVKDLRTSFFTDAGEVKAVNVTAIDVLKLNLNAVRFTGL